MVPSPTYRRRRPEETGLYRALDRGIGEFLAHAQETGREVPHFVDRELTAWTDDGMTV